MSLLVNKRRGKVKDQSAKGTNSKDREQVSSEVTDVGSDHVGGGGNVASREVGNILDHVDLGGLASDEGGSNCKKTQKQARKHSVSKLFLN